MAVFHLKVNIGSRSGGQSARAKADYIEREGRYEPNREELEHRESGNMPEWAKDDPRSYWEAADEHERANGSLYREIQFALPRELNEPQRRELASGFARRLTEGERLPYTLAIHRGGPDGENPHAHLMISERGLDGHERRSEQWFRRHNAKAPEKGGAKKSRTMMSREWVKDTREAWERAANKALGRAGREERVDHRNLAERRDEAERSGDLERAAELSRGAERASRSSGVRRVARGGGFAHPAESGGRVSVGTFSSSQRDSMTRGGASSAVPISSTTYLASPGKSGIPAGRETPAPRRNTTFPGRAIQEVRREYLGRLKGNALRTVRLWKLTPNPLELRFKALSSHFIQLCISSLSSLTEKTQAPAKLNEVQFPVMDPGVAMNFRGCG